MSENKILVFVKLDASGTGLLSELAGFEDMLRAGGSVCERLSLPNDTETLLDRLEQGVVPIIVKPAISG